MKRKTELVRTVSTSKRTSPLRSRPKRRALEPGEAEWKVRRWGRCAVCGTYGRLVQHHVVDENTVRQYGGWAYDPDNALRIGAPLVMGGNPRCNCHDGHHHPGTKDTRLPWSVVPAAARLFAQQLMGEDRAREYARRHYKLNE